MGASGAPAPLAAAGRGSTGRSCRTPVRQSLHAHRDTPAARSIELPRRDKAMALAFVPRCRELFAVAGKAPQTEQCDA